MNEGFLFETYSQKIKSHVVESQDIPCLAMFKSLTVKHHTVTHMIILNDSISKFHQCSIWRFCWGIYMSFSICLGKKNAEVVKFLGILEKNLSLKIKHIFVRERKAMFRLEKFFFVFQTIFKLCFIMQIIYCIIHRCLRFHFILFLFSYISL